MEIVQVKKVNEDEQNQPLKTQQSEEEEKDRISSLPDCLIIDILSRLVYTKQAIRTGTLSKRWQHLWPSLPCLSFDDSAFKGFDNKKPLPDFYLAVDKTLNQCQSNNLNRFRIIVNYDKRFESHVDNWIHFVTSRNVQQLNIFLVYEGYAEDRFVLKDDSFFVNSHFTRFDLGGCLFSPMKPIRWNNLTHLTISYVEVDHDSIAKILSGSPLLDTLVLNFCYGYSFLDITSKSVKSLVVSGYVGDKDKIVVEINAPYITSLTIADDLWLWKTILLQDVSSLVKAYLNYHMYGTRKKDADEVLKRLMLNLRHVKELEIGTSCYEVLARLEVKGFIFPSNMKGVDVTSHPYIKYHSRALADCHDNDSSNASDID